MSKSAKLFNLLIIVMVIQFDFIFKFYSPEGVSWTKQRGLVSLVNILLSLGQQEAIMPEPY